LNQNHELQLYGNVTQGVLSVLKICNHFIIIMLY